jgi:hypothetical protein
VFWRYKTGVHAANLDEISSIATFRHRLQERQAPNKPYKLADEKGMFLLINPNGSKYFRLKYRFGVQERPLQWGYIRKQAYNQPEINGTQQENNLPSLCRIQT